MGKSIQTSVSDGETPDCDQRRLGQRPQRTIRFQSGDGRLGRSHHCAEQFCENQRFFRAADTKDTGGNRIDRAQYRNAVGEQQRSVRLG